MNKRILVAGVIFALSSTVALANGAYIGASIGYDSGNWGLKDSHSISSTQFYGTGALGSAFGGYGAIVDHDYYLGGEAFFSWSSTRTLTKDIAPNHTTGKLATQYGYGLSFLPGLIVGEGSKVYLRFGLVRTRFELTQDPVLNTHVKKTGGQTVPGVQYGFGMQGNVWCNVDLRGEYVHTDYGSLNIFNSKMTPTNNLFAVGVVYNIV